MSRISVLHNGLVLDVVCRRHPSAEGYQRWYVVYLVSSTNLDEIMLGQVMPDRVGWNAICDENPQDNWAAQGYATRRQAIEFMLRNAGYWPKYYGFNPLTNGDAKISE